MLGQRAVADKSNEITAIPLLLDELAASGAITGSLVSINAMGRQSEIAEKIVDLGGDYLLATKDNQKTAHAAIELYFDGAPDHEIDVLAETERETSSASRPRIERDSLKRSAVSFGSLRRLCSRSRHCRSFRLCGSSLPREM